MSTPQIAESLASFLFDTAAKGTVLLLLAIVATLLLRRSSAAMRHAIWSLTMLSLVVLPFASAMLPVWAIPILPMAESTTQPITVAEFSDPVLTRSEAKPLRDTLGESTQRQPEPVQPRRVDHRAEPRQGRDFQGSLTSMPSAQTAELILPEQPPAATVTPAESSSRSATIVALVWVAGLVSSGAFLALCVVRAVVLRRRSAVVSDGVWCRLLAELSQRLRLRRSVELREHSEPIVPLTWGVFRPVVLLPKSAREWAEPMKRSVLLHELAHVRRGDVACQMLGRIACTLFWFHPLAWYGLRRLRQEGEQACDDAVVRSGEKASDYAEQLLQVAHLCCAPRGLSLGVAMAEGNSLERRVKSLFDTGRSHEPVRKSASLILSAACVIALLAISVVRPVASSVDAAELSADPTPTSTDSSDHAKAKHADGSQYAIALPERAAPIEFLKLERLSSEARSKGVESRSPPGTDDTPNQPPRAKPSEPLSETPPPSEPETDTKSEAEELSDFPTKEPVAKGPLDSVIWWKTVDGLQAGFLLTSPGFPNQRVPADSLATYRVLVRNTGGKETRFVARLIPHEHRDAPFLIPSDNITEALDAPTLPIEFRAEGSASVKRADPAYVITLMPGEAVFMPGQSGLHDLGIFVGDADSEGFPKIAKVKPGMNWIVQPLQIETFPIPAAVMQTSLLGRYQLTKVDASGKARTEPASRMVAFSGGKTLYPRIQLDVGTLTAAAVRNAKHAIWGKVDKGLQCGIRLINPKPSYLIGDTLEAEFLWRNTSDATIYTPLPRQSDLYPIVTNAEGQELSIDFGTRMLLIALSFPFEAGKVRSLGVSKITLVEEGSPPPRSNREPAHLSVEPGVYKLSGLGGVSAPDGGRPRSGVIPFKVIRR
jgi:beta-lactamase regulating signal transducer with metallopeptidase domain